MRAADILHEIFTLGAAKAPAGIVNSFYDRAPNYPFADYISCADNLIMELGDFKSLCKDIMHVYH